MVWVRRRHGADLRYIPVDSIEHFPGGTMFSGPKAVEIFRLHALASALSLETKGIRLSKGRSALKAAKLATGLRSNDRLKHIARIAVMLEGLKREVVVNEQE